MKSWRIALFLLLLSLVLMIPVSAQEATPAVEPTVEVTVESIDAALTPTEEATIEAVATVVVEPTDEAVVEAPPETTPVAGVAEEVNDDQLQGASLLVLLVGLGAIGLVAFGTVVRSNYKPPQE